MVLSIFNIFLNFRQFDAFWISRGLFILRTRFITVEILLFANFSLFGIFVILTIFDISTIFNVLDVFAVFGSLDLLDPFCAWLFQLLSALISVIWIFYVMFDILFDNFDHNLPKISPFLVSFNKMTIFSRNKIPIH